MWCVKCKYLVESSYVAMTNITCKVVSDDCYVLTTFGLKKWFWHHKKFIKFYGELAYQAKNESSFNHYY